MSISKKVKKKWKENVKNFWKICWAEKITKKIVEVKLTLCVLEGLIKNEKKLRKFFENASGIDIWILGDKKSDNFDEINFFHCSMIIALLRGDPIGRGDDELVEFWMQRFKRPNRSLFFPIIQFYT